ncbi:redoxin domain-containing protein [Mycobacterium sp. NAZ190054]|uniref:redoxin domain-containing protein n=1 Tax=Mycobacterium sp. NAZ190054 TaxID=1747766 RepID=UPI001E5EC6ED|nr:redoxin domain-containing protein [Mycobacterium sp. NAZ190054]
MILAACLLLVGALFSAAPSASADTALDGNNQRLRFYGTELSGALFDGRSLIGKPAVLWFWTPAPYCSTCRDEAPIVSRVAAANPDVRFVGVAGRWDAASMRRFVDDHHLGFTNLTDANGQIWQAFFVPWPSAWAFLRPDGTGDLVNNPALPMSERELTNRVTALAGR